MPIAIQSISRCLLLLEQLNLRNGATVADLCSVTGLTRGTTYRILETLRRDGFVRKDEGSAHYWLSERVRALSDGYQDEWWIDAFARKIIVDLGNTTRWPVKLLTLNGCDMLTRVTTDFASPFTDKKYPTGLRVALLWSAAGRTFLAFCEEADRQALLKMVAAGSDPPGVAGGEGAPSPDRGRIRFRTDGYAVVDTSRHDARQGVPTGLDTALRQIRLDGYTIVHNTGTMFYTLAVPVISSGVTIGAIAVHIFRSAMRPTEAVAAYLDELRLAAEEIGRRFHEA